jgi:hypothetical protein
LGPEVVGLDPGHPGLGGKALRGNGQRKERERQIGKVSK